MEKKLSRLTSDLRYELVAYLDGELDAEATARVEKLLSENAVARQDIEQLAATYAMFDHLPRPKAKADFSEKTLAMAKLEDVRPDVTQSPLYRTLQKSIPYLGWTLAMCVAGLAGFGVTRFWVREPHDPLVENFEVIRDLDKFSEVGSIDFLQQLQSSEELLRDIRGGQGANSTR